VKLIFPVGVTEFIDEKGNTFLPDSNGIVDIDDEYGIRDFLNAGFTQCPYITGTTAQRPTRGLYPGLLYLDTTLAAAGKPIWRNAANTGWVDSAGASA
jgi:hypothetical protein